MIRIALALLSTTAILALPLQDDHSNSSYVDYDDWRIIGGQIAAEGAFPYMAALRYNGNFQCGSSIISARTILTAAHCLRHDNMPQNYQVKVGTTKKDGPGGDIYSVKRVVKLPHTENEDIGVVILSTPIVFKPHIRAIPLETEMVGATDAVLSGWGLIDYPDVKHTEDLQYVHLKTITPQECAHAANENHICTSTKDGKGACFGDSGGPLVVNGRQVGIVSRGKPCAVGEPDIFTRVSKFVSWIRQNME